MTDLSPHFSLEELTFSDTAQRLGIDNTPTPEVLPRLTLLANGLERVRAALDGHPMRIHSGLRVEALERVLCAKDFPAWCARHGRAPASAWPEYFARKGHPKGWCADFTCPAFGPPAAIVERIRASSIGFDQLIEEGTWVHISFAPAMRGAVLTARFDANGTPSYARA